ncbi:MAG TPA: hypothetical protein PK074_05465 [Spirochaetales bacterium]|nr:hypothetical protein [Spirochaetales bacterium]HQK34152.1 hypothetical protein [Spirochaetales bacterium]
MKKLHYVFFISILCIFTPLVHAQKLIERTVAVFDFAPMNNSEADYSSICADTIAIELERIGYTVIDTNIIRKNYKGSLLDEPALIEFAKTQKADVVVLGFYVIEGNTLHVGVRAIDILTGLNAVAAFNTGKGGVAVFETIDDISAKVAQRIREALQPLPESELIIYREVTKVETTTVEEVVEQGTPVTIILQSKDNGAEVFIGETLLGVIENGQLAVDTKEGAELIITIKKQGFYPKTIQFKATSKKPTVTARGLVPVSYNEVQVFVASDRPLGFNGMYSRAIFPDIFYYGAQSGFFVIPMDFNFDTETHDPRAFFEIPLFVTLTFYPIGLFNPQYIFQPYLRLATGGELYFANFPSPFQFGAATMRSMVSFGMTLIPGTIAMSGELQFVSPSYLSWGIIGEIPFTLHLCIGVRYIW